MVSASAGGFDHFRGSANTSPWGLPWTERLCDLDLPEALAGNVRRLTDWHDMAAAQRPMLRLLLDAGADSGLKDAEGRDAFDHAALGGPTGLDRLLAGKAAEGDQPRCDLDLSRSPEVRGLRLGMTLRGVATRFRPSTMPEAEWCGRLSLEFDWADDLLGQRAPQQPELAGVRRIRLGFLDGRLAYFRVTYDPREAPPKPEQFRAALSSCRAHGAGAARRGGRISRTRSAATASRSSRESTPGRAWSCTTPGRSTRCCGGGPRRGSGSYVRRRRRRSAGGGCSNHEHRRRARSGDVGGSADAAPLGHLSRARRSV